MLKEKIEIPTNCPSCEHELTLVTSQLFCTNTSCPARSFKMIKHFITTLGIKGLGDKTLEKLELNSIVDIYKLSIEELTNKIGSDKLASKIFDQIQISKKAGLHKVLASFGIILVGKSAADKIVKEARHIDDIDKELCLKAGLGEKATNNLMEFLASDYYKELRSELPLSFKIDCFSKENQAVPSKGDIVVCITGKLTSFANKALAETAIQVAGHRTVSSVTKITTHLVDELDGTSSKRQKANSLGITIIPNLQQFLKEIKSND